VKPAAAPSAALSKLTERLGFGPQPRSLAAARWALIASAPAPIVLIGWWRGGPIEHAPLEALVPTLAALLTLMGAGVLLPTRPGLANAFALLGMIFVIAVAAPALIASPPLALMLGVVLVVAALLLFRVVRRRRNVDPCDPPEHRLHAFRGAALSTTLLWVLSTLSRSLHDDTIGLAGLVTSASISLALLLAWVLVSFRAYRQSRGSDTPRASQLVRKLVILAGAIAVPLWLEVADWTLTNVADALASLTILGLIVLARLDRQEETQGGGLWDLILGHPSRLMVVTFAILCAVGSILLALPRASADGVGLPLSDAAFTSVSAVCVTGLSVIDVGKVFSPLGQFFLLVLIQAGGLGIMTFSTAAMRLLGGRLSLRHEGAMAQLVSPEDRSRIFASTIRLIAFTFSVELLGALMIWLSLVTSGAEDPLSAIWSSLFTAISAFCNAGFALTTDNLVAFQQTPAILHIVALLIIMGGLSPAVVLIVPRWLSGRPVPPQARLALITTLVLLGVGFLAFLAFEWTRSLGGLDVGDRIHNAWFQSVTLRTAGFNSVDLSVTHPATLLVMLGLMLIGGSPGGTAGGFKTTTLAVLTLGLIASIRGREEINAGRRRISHRSYFKAAAVVGIFLMMAFGAVIALLLTQDMPPRVAIFETFSAIGTVGLTIGGTNQLDEVGRGIIMVCMFVGRVGPLTLLMLLSRETKTRENWKQPETDIEVA
jgi:trk system potassium uptake protein TrkH